MYIGVVAVSSIFAGWQPLVLVLVIGGALLVAIGSVDDWFKAQRLEFPVSPKLIVQVLVAVLSFGMGIRFPGISLSWFGGGAEEILLFPVWLSFLATLVWIVGFINMVNFLDGLDGLAGGVTTFSATALFFIALAKGQGLTALVAAAVVGAALAFLRFNFYPAQLFMGDAGATFLGFCLAIVSLEGTMKGATLISFVVTVLALGLPVIDTLQVLISRLLSGTPMYQADRRHMHHRLLSWGFTAKQAVFLLYLISLILSAISLLIFLLIT